MSTLSKPKRRRRVFCSKEPPLPIPVESITGIPPGGVTWNYYTGELIGNSVIVKQTDDMNYLYRMGFYGKGQYSKSEPQSGAAKSGLKVMSKRRFLQHTRWQRQSHGQFSESDDDLDERKLPTVKCNVKRLREDLDVHTDNGLRRDPAKETDIKFQDDEEYSNHDEATALSNSKTKCVGTSRIVLVHSNRNPAASNSKTSTDAWGEEDVDFWGSDGGGDSWSKTEAKTSEQFWGSVDADPWDKSVEGTSDQFWGADTDGNTIGEQGVHKVDECTGANTCNKEIKNSDSFCENKDQSQQITNSSQVTSLVGTNEEEQGCHDGPSEELVTMSTDSHVHGNTSSLVGDEVNEQQVKDDITVCISTEGQRFDQRSLQEESDGELLVIEDTDDSEEEVAIATKQKWRPCQKRDPYPVEEYLQLSLEEAFFLSYGLGCLIVLDEDKTPLNLTDMWCKFCAIHPRFLPNYIVYHYFRSKGWVPKSGLKYGAEYLLYKHGPPFYHSTYSILIRMVDEDLHDISCYDNRPLSWISLAGMNRITEHVNKELMFCYVIKPDSLTVQDMASPKCIPQFKVQELIMKRWVSKQERDKDGNFVPELIP